MSHQASPHHDASPSGHSNYWGGVAVLLIVAAFFLIREIGPPRRTRCFRRVWRRLRSIRKGNAAVLPKAVQTRGQDIRLWAASLV